MFVVCTQELVKKGLKANAWADVISNRFNGKGGGKDISAQASVTGVDNVEEIIKLANKFASTALN